jgi:hypothetical protein
VHDQLFPRPFSRRALFAGAAGVAGSAILRLQPAIAGFAIRAHTTWDATVELKSKPSEDKKTVAELGPGTPVSLIDGPTENGWFKVLADDGTKGWLPRALVVFTHRARLLWDQYLFDAPGGGGVIDWVRHGIVVTLAGSPVSGWALARYGDLVGYIDLNGVETTDEEATNPFAEWWIDVNRSNWTVGLYIGATCVDRFTAALSRDQGEGFYATACGTHYIYHLNPDLSYTPYAQAYIMYWAGFDPQRNNGFHSWTMDSNGWLLAGGDGPTAGCVSTAPEIAAIIYNFCWMGMRVEVHW